MQKLLEQLTEAAKEDLAFIRAQFTDPSDDWEPFMLMVNAQGDMGHVMIDPHFFHDDVTKEILANQVLHEPIREFEAKAACFVSSAWYARQERDQPQVRPSAHPDRREVVFAVTVSATEVGMTMAEIERTEDAPPTLGDWEEVSLTGPEAGVPGGLFVPALRRALTPQG